MEQVKVVIAVFSGVAIACFLAFFYYTLSLSVQRRAKERRLVNLGMSEAKLEELRQGIVARLERAFNRSSYGTKLRHTLERANLHLPPARFVGLLIGLGFVIFLAIQLAFGLTLILSLVFATFLVLITARLYLGGRKDGYLQALAAQMPDVATVLSNSLRAGMSVYQALHEVANRSAPPANLEFRQLLREVDALGAPLAETMERMMNRLPIEELRMLLTTILVQRQAGGDLARALAVLSSAISARHTLRGEVHNLSAEARYTSTVIVVLPIVILAIINQMMPGSVALFLNNPVGLIIVALYVGVQVGAFMLIRNISKIQV